jgi:hypothetical protein
VSQPVTVRVRITRMLLAKRVVVLNVEDFGEGNESALEQVRSGAVDIPDDKDPRWNTEFLELSEEHEQRLGSRCQSVELAEPIDPASPSLEP